INILTEEGTSKKPLTETDHELTTTLRWNELSSGKVVSSRHYQTPVPQRGDHLGVNTSKPFGSQSSHTAPPRPVRERLEFPSEQSSERTLSNSNERRSALERISEPDLRNSISRDKPRSSGVQDRLMVLEGIEGSSSAPRIPAPLRLQDSDSEGQINITIPHAICKTGAKRKVSRTPTKQVRRSPLLGQKLKKSSMVVRPLMPPRKKPCLGHEDT
ncbi:unnamed protein product, partial [Brassica napus]